jgi:hypothetical protein
VIVSEGFVRSRSGHGHDATQFTFKTGDALYRAFECRSVDQLIAVGATVASRVPFPVAAGTWRQPPVGSVIDLEPARGWSTWPALRTCC